MFDNKLCARKLYLILLVFMIQQHCYLTAEDLSTELESDDSEESIGFEDQSDQREELLSTTTTAETETNYLKNDFSDDNDNYDEEFASQSNANVRSKFSTSGAAVYPDPFGIAESFLVSSTTPPTSNYVEYNQQKYDTNGKEYASVIRRRDDLDDPATKNYKHFMQSAFEKHKSQVRSYRPYGHKHHKKKHVRYRKYNYPLYYERQMGLYNRNSDADTDGEPNVNPVSGNVLRPAAKSRNSGRYHSTSAHHHHQRQHHSPHHHPHHHHHHQHHQHNHQDLYQLQHLRQYPTENRQHLHVHHRHHQMDGLEEPGHESKWPHLSRVRYQLYEETDRDENLPPYIKKYKRRNKQLLDLLEGTMPPSPSPSHSSMEMIITNSNKKRQRKPHPYRNHKNPKSIIEDLFEEQRANPNNPNRSEDDQYMNDAGTGSMARAQTAAIQSASNKEPSAGGTTGTAVYQREPSTLSTNISSGVPSLSSLHSSSSVGHSSLSAQSDSTSISTSLSAPALPAESDSILLSSLSASPNSSDDDELKIIQKNELPGDKVDISEEDEAILSDGVSSNSQQPDRSLSSRGRNSAIGSDRRGGSLATASHEELQVSPKANKFIYHRVPSPRVVGLSGTGLGGSKKQRLPFVAITDRRLEMSKMRQKDFEQNHLPLP